MCRQTSQATPSVGQFNYRIYFPSQTYRQNDKNKTEHIINYGIKGNNLLSPLEPYTLTHQILIASRYDILTESLKSQRHFIHLVILHSFDGIIYILLHFDENNLRRKSNNS